MIFIECWWHVYEFIDICMSHRIHQPMNVYECLWMSTTCHTTFIVYECLHVYRMSMNVYECLQIRIWLTNECWWMSMKLHARLWKSMNVYEISMTLHRKCLWIHMHMNVYECLFFIEYPRKPMNVYECRTTFIRMFMNL